MCVYLHAKCEVFSTVLMIFKQVVILFPTPQNELLKAHPN